MQDKHPAAPFDRRPRLTPVSTPLYVTDVDILAILKSFAPGALGGIDGLHPQHLLNLLESSSTSGALPGVVSEFVNLVSSGGVPETIRQYFFGSRLFALLKLGGGLGL